MKMKALLPALLLGLAAPTAMAATYTHAGPNAIVNDGSGNWYTFVGAYNVADGPAAGRNPPVYSALEAAFNIFSPTFGGLMSDYAVSIYSPFFDPTQVFFDPVLGFNVPTAPPLFNPATGQIVPGQTVKNNALISHTGWYDSWWRTPDPAVDLIGISATLIPLMSSYAQPYVMSNAPAPGVVYNIPGGTGVGPLVPSNSVPTFVKAEARSAADPNILTDGTVLDVPPAGYSVPSPPPTPLAWSAYVRDHMAGAAEREFFTNYVWKKAIPPIPEPETYVMLLAGLGLITLMARRRTVG